MRRERRVGEGGTPLPAPLPPTAGCWDAVGWRLRAEDVITVAVGSHGKSPGYREAGARFSSMPCLS